MADNTVEAQVDEYLKRWNVSSRRQVAFNPEKDDLDVEFISTGIPNVDAILGGGFPRARITVEYGEESSGKTLLCQLAAADAQNKHDGFVVICDAERALSLGWCRATGMLTDAKHLLILRPRFLEEAFDMMVDALENLKPDMLVFDSLPALLTQAIEDKTMSEGDHQGTFPRKAGEGVGRLNTANHNTAIVVINQLRSKMGIAYGNPDDMPGGHKVRHEASIVIRVRRGTFKTVKEGEVVRRVGYEARIRTEKNKLVPPWQEASFDFTFDGKVDIATLLLSRAIELGYVIVGKGGFHTFPQVEGKIHGKDAAEKYLKDNPEYAAQLEEICNQHEVTE